jgi:beta-phosphoglucomutase family hydrolase
MEIWKNTAAVIFDMDGVIVDNHAYHHEAWMTFFQKYGLTVEGDVSHFFGRTNQDILEAVFPDELDQAHLYQFAGEKEKLYRELYEGNVEMAEGLPELLENLLKMGMKLAVATSAPPGNVDFVMKNTGLRRYFDLVVDSSMVAKGKPDPEIYLLAARKLNVKPARCVVVEDSVSGIRAALAAGMKVVAITTTSGRERLAEADMIIDNFDELGCQP